LYERSIRKNDEQKSFGLISLINLEHTVIDLDKAALSLNCLYAFCADLANSSASSGLKERKEIYLVKTVN